MQRLPAIDPSTATGETKRALDQVEARLGNSPNVMRTIANSPTALRGYLALDSVLSAGNLAPSLREQIALAVAEANACRYCVAAHTAAGKRLGLDEAATSRNSATPGRTATTRSHRLSDTGQRL